MPSENNVLEIPFLLNVGLFTTFKCQVSCPHCIVEAGPHRTEEMALENAFNWIEQISDYRNNYIKGISLTGGEPFFDLDTLVKISEFGSKSGLIVTAITNGFWAVTPGQALKILRQLPSIKLLVVSADVHHQKNIPLERVQNAIRAAKECNIIYRVYVSTEDENQKEHKELMGKLQQFVELDKISVFYIFPVGRAQSSLAASGYQLSDEPPVSACWFSSSPIIFPDGKVVACIGPLITIKSHHPLVLGNLRKQPLSEIFDAAETNVPLHALRVWGPKKLLAMIKDAGLGKSLPQKYSPYSCNVCYELMSNTTLSDFFNQLAHNTAFKAKVAYGRAYFLQETKMAEIFNLPISLREMSQVKRD